MFREKLPVVTRVFALLHNLQLAEAPRRVTIALKKAPNKTPTLRIHTLNQREWFSTTERHAFDLSQSVSRPYFDSEGRKLPLAR
jgi:hypothetical protein